MNKKLWLDDVRRPPDDSWTWSRSVDDALELCGREVFSEWSLDHDLGGALAHYGKGPYDHNAKTGLDFVRAAILNQIVYPDRISIHSTNGAAALEISMWLYHHAAANLRDIEIILRPMLGRLMDLTPYYDPALRGPQ